MGGNRIIHHCYQDMFKLVKAQTVNILMQDKDTIKLDCT